MVSGSADPGADEFRAGTWQAGDISKGEDTAKLVERISTETSFPQAASTRFVAALYHCVVNVEGFQAAQFLHKVLQNPRLLVPCATHKQYLELLSEIYNYKTAQENRVRFNVYPSFPRLLMMR
ncbi:MAG: hypothetical protein EOO62_03395 [Hymenobacter sp.]|nr:MAG: hypothetical protein EOO62_03395 [Hymenobacter sp.]